MKRNIKKTLSLLLIPTLSLGITSCNNITKDDVKTEISVIEGSKILTGSSEPSSSLGIIGDSYIDLTNYNYYVKEESGWVLKGNIKGAQGEKDDKGEDAITYVPCIFYNYDGTKLYEFYFAKGTSATYGGITPTKEDTLVDGHTAHWSFSGWDKSLDNITEPTVFTAQYESKVNAIFKNYDGTVLETKEVNFGEVPTYTGVTPTMPDTVDGSTTINWTFDGWDKSLTNAYDDVIYTAKFNSPNALKITFLNEDGTELGYTYCGVGGKATYNGTTPTKDEVNEDGTITRYEFSGWDQKLTNIQTSMSVTAKYEESTWYECKFVNYNNTLLETKVVGANATATYTGKTPFKDFDVSGTNIIEYTFSNWDKSTSSITSPTTFIAKYNSTSYTGYIVTYKDETNTTLAKVGVKSGKDAIYPYSFDELVDKYYSYDDTNVTMWTGWDKSQLNINETTTLTLKTTTISRHQNGEYPQTIVSDSTILQALRNMTSSDQDNQGYYTYNGLKYSYVNYDWRLVEPIKWRYMSTDESGYVQMVSQNVLTTHVWNSTTEQYEDGSYANNYYKSDIRKWLNNEFLSEAFYYDDSLIVTSTVDNSASTTYSSSNQYACQNSQDKLYLLSYQDVFNKAYGFTDDNSRVAKKDGSAPWYWLRSPGSGSSGGADGVSGGGGINYDIDVIINFGVRVACKFNLNN